MEASEGPSEGNTQRTHGAWWKRGGNGWGVAEREEMREMERHGSAVRGRGRRRGDGVRLGDGAEGAMPREATTQGKRHRGAVRVVAEGMRPSEGMTQGWAAAGTTLARGD